MEDNTEGVGMSLGDDDREEVVMDVSLGEGDDAD